MKLDFADRKLAKDCADERSRVRAFGSDRAKKLRVRLSLLEGAASMELLRTAPGRFHQLTGDRKGQFAADLDGPYRLIFEPVLDDHTPKAHAQGLVWSLITHIRILEIVNYHG